MARKKKSAETSRRRGQGSTEYLVVLVVVLVIAVIAIALLGGFTPFAPSTTIEQSQTYWHGATPFSIEEVQISTQNGTG
ncbi:Uncharacterised protein [uncultured archaeon]|nr:Uncharacterised protein [uncultured archaeon]